MLEKKFANKDLGIELNSYIDKQQNVWFRGKDVAQILGYSDTDDAVRRHVSIENKMTQFIQPKCSPGKTPGQQNNKNVPPVKHRANKMTQFIQPKCSPAKTAGQQNNIGGVKKTPQQSNIGGVKTPGQQNDTGGKYCIFINKPGFYELVFGSK